MSKQDLRLGQQDENESCVSTVLHEPLSAEQALGRAEVCKAIGEPVRLRLLSESLAPAQDAVVTA